MNKIKHIFVELGNHLPFSIFGVTLGLVCMGVLTFIATLLQAEEILPVASQELFHVFHPVHVLFSALATTAMFWKHEKNFLKAILVGLLGSVLVCGLSDIVLPFIGGKFLGIDMHMHLCIVEHPSMVLVFAITGIITGILVPSAIERSTEISHATHVFISSAASILYLSAFGITEWIHALGSVFLIVLVAVMFPCCLSDIIFPLTCLHKGCGCEHDSEN